MSRQKSRVSRPEGHNLNIPLSDETYMRLVDLSEKLAPEGKKSLSWPKLMDKIGKNWVAIAEDLEG